LTFQVAIRMAKASGRATGRGPLSWTFWFFVPLPAGAMVRPPSLRACALLLGSLSSLALPASGLALLAAGEANAQEAGYGQTLGTSPMERQLFDYGPGKSGSGGSSSVLDSTNPLDLLNKLRRSTSMENATPPGSAVDQALRDFDAQTAKPAPAGSSGQLKGI
jgi:hypothetical protein